MTDQTIAQIALDHHFKNARQRLTPHLPQCPPEVAIALMDLQVGVKDVVARIEAGDFATMEQFVADMNEPDDPAEGR
jgi:hypothetical protein